MARHELDLEDAQTLRTRDFDLTEIAVGDLASHRAMGLVQGDAGLGKTFAVDSALEQLRPLFLKLGVTYSKHKFPGKPTPRAVAAGLLRGLTQIDHDGTLARIEFDLLDALSERRHLFVIDEAQVLTHEPVEYLRYIYDHERTECSVLLVGGNGTWRLLRDYPMLRSRIYRRVEFQPLAVERILQHIPRFHWIYKDAAPELIREIDQTVARGNLREWTLFTHTLVKIMRKFDHPLDRELVANALVLHGER
jgi:type II secretory pathway predicted ATPase ExeA